jgi:hypothetical protein
VRAANFEGERPHDLELSRVAKATEVIADPELTAIYAERKPCDVTIHLRDGRALRERVDYAAASRRIRRREIDLDPASHELAQRYIKAKRFYTPEDDGLKQQWHGRVWLNPPYSQPCVEHFTDKLIAEYRAGRVTEAILLTHNFADTAWFQRVIRTSAAICFASGRIDFERVDEQTGRPSRLGGRPRGRLSAISGATPTSLLWCSSRWGLCCERSLEILDP